MSIIYSLYDLESFSNDDIIGFLNINNIPIDDNILLETNHYALIFDTAKLLDKHNLLNEDSRTMINDRDFS